MKCMQKPVIFFDWDGTLGDSMDLCLGEIRLALQRVGLEEAPEDKIRACNGPTHEESIGVLGVDPRLGPDFLRERRRAELELIPKLLRTYPGVPQMLEQLSAVAELAIVSNGQKDYIEHSVETMGLKDYFVRMQASIPGMSKTEVLALMLQEMQPDRACLVGDRRTDITAGVGNHLPTLAIGYGYGTADEFEGADACAASVEEAGSMLMHWVETGKFQA